MKYKIRIKEKIVFKTNNLKEALKIIKDIFNNGHDNVYLDGGRLSVY
jgi:hypothetical protein